MPRPMRVPITVDLVVLTIRDDALSVLLVRRGIPPHRGRYALPGGFVRENEDLDAAARRELLEETGLEGAHTGHLEQLATFGTPARDPRERIVTVAYLALAPALPMPEAGGDAASAHFVALDAIEDEELAFDHATILRAGVERARAKLEYTTLAAAFCAPTFTILELRKVYEVVWGRALDPANFNRKVTKSAGFVVATGEHATRETGRPAQLYKRGPATLLHPPLLRGD